MITAPVMKGLKRILSQLIICYSHEMILGGTEINLHKVRVVLQVNFRDDPKGGETCNISLLRC